MRPHPKRAATTESLSILLGHEPKELTMFFLNPTRRHFLQAYAREANKTLSEQTAAYAAIEYPALEKLVVRRSSIAEIQRSNSTNVSGSGPSSAGLLIVT